MDMQVFTGSPLWHSLPRCQPQGLFSSLGRAPSQRDTVSSPTPFRLVVLIMLLESLDLQFHTYSARDRLFITLVLGFEVVCKILRLFKYAIMGKNFTFRGNKSKVCENIYSKHTPTRVRTHTHTHTRVSVSIYIYLMLSQVIVKTSTKTKQKQTQQQQTNNNKKETKQNKTNKTTLVPTIHILELLLRILTRFYPNCK